MFAHHSVASRTPKSGRWQRATTRARCGVCVETFAVELKLTARNYGAKRVFSVGNELGTKGISAKFRGAMSLCISSWLLDIRMESQLAHSDVLVQMMRKSDPRVAASGLRTLRVGGTIVLLRGHIPYHRWHGWESTARSPFTYYTGRYCRYGSNDGHTSGHTLLDNLFHHPPTTTLCFMSSFGLATHHGPENVSQVCHEHTLSLISLESNV